MQNQKVEYSKLPVELQEKLKGWEKNSPVNKQLEVLSDIADMVQELLGLADESAESKEKSANDIGALLMDAREQLILLNEKEAPEAIDYSKPIIEVLERVEKAIGAKDYSPKITVQSPSVNVPKPEVSVNVDAPRIDLSGLENLLKTEVPKAFEKAISLIPETVLPEYPDRWDEVMEWLQSIDTASRLKPEAPTQIKVVNPDGSSIGSLSGSTAYEGRNDTTTDTNLVYLGKAEPGSDITDAVWQIKRYNKSAGHMSFADDITTFTKVWDDRTTYSY